MATKQVIVWRNDLQCRLGKKMAQAGHAAQAFLLDKIHKSLVSSAPSPSGSYGSSTLFFSQAELDYIQGNYRKVVLRVDNEEQLVALYEKAKSVGLNVHLITDDGLTEFDGPTKTCLAIGPDDDAKINALTGDLRLL